MIDWKRVSELHEEIGAAEFDVVVEIFLEEVNAVINRLRDNPDPARFEEDLHFLKGCAINLGFEDLANRCRSNETIAARGQPDSIDLQVIFDCFDTSSDEFFAKVHTMRAA